MNGTTNTGDKSNPEPPYASGKDEMTDKDYSTITTLINDLGTIYDWLDELDGDYETTFQAQEHIAKATNLLRGLV